MPLVSISYIFKVFIEGAMAFIGKRGLAVKRRLFKTAKAEVVNNIKGVSRRDSR